MFSALLIPFFGVAFVWYSFTSLPIVNLGYECYRASGFNVRSRMDSVSF